MTPPSRGEGSWIEAADAAYEASRKIIEDQERRIAVEQGWTDLLVDIQKWLQANWKLLLGILIGYISAGAIIYLDRWLQTMGITQ